MNAVPTPDSGNPKPSSRPGGAGTLIGVVVGGRYKLVRVIGEGGTSAVFEAEHVHMHKRLAVKVLSPEMSRSPEAVARFEREAVAASRIDHPNVAAATDFGALDDGSFFLVLDYVEGKTLREELGATAKLEPLRALHVARQVVAGLAAAHALGIVHRDLKPENLVLTPRDGDPDFIKILDFGIAKVPVSEIAPDAPKPEALTKLGMVYGTPEYMSPEQAMGTTVDTRADLYALGVILYEMLAGVRPFDEDNKVVLLGMHVTAPIPAMAERAPRANVPQELEQIVRKLMAKTPAERYQTADEVLAALDAQIAKLAARANPNPPAPLIQVSTLPLPVAAPRTQSKPTSPVRRVATHLIERLENALPLDRVPLPFTKRQKLWLGLGVATLLLASFLTLAIVIIVHVTSKPSATGTPGGTTAVTSDHRAKCIAASASGDRGSVVREASAFAASSKDAVEDDEVARAVGAAALDDAVQAQAFDLLETKLGRAGADVLYTLAFGPTATSQAVAAEHAKRSLQLDGVKSHMTPALAVTVAIRMTKDPCEAKSKYFAQAAKDGDARTLDALAPLLKRTGCGRKGRNDCHPCLRTGADSVEKTADAIRARATNRTP